MSSFFSQYRNLTHSQQYWASYITGVYEYGPFVGAHENDPDWQIAWLGDTPSSVTPRISMVGNEVIRDVAVQHGWLSHQDHVRGVVALHEVSSHQLNFLQSQLGHLPGPYPGDNVLVVPGSDTDEAQAPNAIPIFRDETIRGIRHDPRQLP